MIYCYEHFLLETNNKTNCIFKCEKKKKTPNDNSPTLSAINSEVQCMPAVSYDLKASYSRLNDQMTTRLES